MQSQKPGKKQTLDPGIPPDEILEQLNRILSHPEFQATPQQRDFLRFVVTETLEGREHQIKGHTVATQVLGRKPDFDPKSDPAVSIQANRLRKALERYFLVAGGNDPIRIEIPKGTYVPVFHARKARGSDEAATQRGHEDFGERDPWPTVLVRPFRNLTGDPEQDYVSAGLASELAIELSRYQDIRVWMHGLGGQRENASDSAARFVIEGSLHRDTTGIKVAVHLIDTTTGTKILGDMHRSKGKAPEIIAFQEEIARVVAVKVAGEHGIIAEALSSESRDKPPSDLTTHEAILRYYQ